MLIGQKLGRYKLVDFLGEGGIASIYRARPIFGGEDVAIKVAKPGKVEVGDFTARLKREALVGAQLNHPNVLRIFGYGKHENSVYVVMQLLSGGNLAEKARQTPMPLADVSLLLDQVASALDYMHSRGVVHRDLKLHNVLLDDDGQPYLSDFGMIKALDESITRLYNMLDESYHPTRKGIIMGTPAYMSPEQCLGDPVDARSDIYSLGIVLYELLTGEVPFRAESPVRIMHMHITEPPAPVTVLKPELPPRLDAVVQRALGKNPKDRYAKASDLAAAFKTAITTPKSITIPNPISRQSSVIKPARAATEERPRLDHILALIATGLLITAAIVLFLSQIHR